VTTIEIYQAVARGDMTAEQGAELMMQERESKTMKAIWNFVKRLNRNQIMLLVGLVVAEGPDVAAVANFLGASGIPHLTGVVHFLGWLSTALASAAIAWPSIRSKLASFGLTTPPGALAPWTPGKPGDPNAVGGVEAGKVLPMQTPTPVTRPETPSSKGTP